MTASTRYLIAPLWCWTLLLFHCTSAVHRKDERLTLDTLRFLSRAVEEIQAHTQTPPLPYLEHLGWTMDSLCERRIRITRTPDLQDLIAQTDRILVVDTLFSRVQDTSLFHAAIACKELTFRVLVEMQNCLKFAFDNSDAFEKYLADRREAERLEKSYQEYKEDRHEKAYGGLEVHDDYIFKEQVSLLIPYIHANQKYASIKTAKIVDVAAIIGKASAPLIRKRGWLAIERMLAEIDLGKSEYGYEPFQRSARGLATQKDHLTAVLESLLRQEQDPKVIRFASGIVEKIEKQQKAPLDRVFLHEVKLAGKRSKNAVHGASSRHIKPDLSAQEWFDRAYRAMDDSTKIDCYSRAIALDSLYVHAFNNRGNIYEKLGETDRALRDYERAIDLDSTYAAAYYNRGTIYQKTGRESKAAREYSRAIRHGLSTSEVYTLRGISYSRSQQLDRAIDDLSRAIDMDSTNSTAFKHRANVLQKMTEFRRAIRDYDRAEKMTPDDISVYINRGICYRQMNDYPEALQDFHHALQVDSTNAEVYNNLGLCYFEMKDKNRAIYNYKKAVQLSPDFANAYYNLGCAYWASSDWDSVKVFWQKCLQSDPDHEKAREGLARIPLRSFFSLVNMIRTADNRFSLDGNHGFEPSARIWLLIRSKNGLFRQAKSPVKLRGEKWYQNDISLDEDSSLLYFVLVNESIHEKLIENVYRNHLGPFQQLPAEHTLLLAMPVKVRSD